MKRGIFFDKPTDIFCRRHFFSNLEYCADTKIQETSEDTQRHGKISEQFAEIRKGSNNINEGPTGTSRVAIHRKCPLGSQSITSVCSMSVCHEWSVCVFFSETFE